MHIETNRSKYKKDTEDKVWNPIVLWRIECNYIFGNRKSEPDKTNDEERVQVICYETQDIKWEKQEIVSTRRKKKAQKIEGRNGDEYPLCYEKTNIGVFWRILDKSVMDILDFRHIFV